MYSKQSHNAAVKICEVRSDTNSEFNTYFSLYSLFTKRCVNYNHAKKKKNLRGSVFSSLAPDLLRPLMQIESIAIFQLEYLRRNQSPTCHSRALKTTDDADDRENRSCARGQEIRGCQKFYMRVWLDPRFQLVLFLSSSCDNIICLGNLLFLLISSSDT